MLGRPNQEYINWILKGESWGGKNKRLYLNLITNLVACMYVVYICQVYMYNCVKNILVKLNKSGIL